LFNQVLEGIKKRERDGKESGNEKLWEQKKKRDWRIFGPSTCIEEK
jgi:hypothetical protein